MISGAESGGIPGVHQVGGQVDRWTEVLTTHRYFQKLRVEGFLVSTRWEDRWTEVLTALL
jgi:hypothetical protein